MNTEYSGVDLDLVRSCWTLGPGRLSYPDHCGLLARRQERRIECRCWQGCKTACPGHREVNWMGVYQAINCAAERRAKGEDQ